jgi:hypothetical protein
VNTKAIIVVVSLVAILSAGCINRSSGTAHDQILRVYQEGGICADWVVQVAGYPGADHGNLEYGIDSGLAEQIREYVGTGDVVEFTYKGVGLSTPCEAARNVVITSVRSYSG